MKKYKPYTTPLREEAKRLRIQQKIPKEVVRMHHCPRCRAVPGKPCSNFRGRLRSSNHIERAMDAAGWL